MPLGYRGQPSQVVQGQRCMKGLLCDESLTTRRQKKKWRKKGDRQNERKRVGKTSRRASGAGFCSSSPASTGFCHENFMFPQIVLTLESYHTICSTICLRIGPDLDGYRAMRMKHCFQTLQP